MGRAKGAGLGALGPVSYSCPPGPIKNEGSRTCVSAGTTKCKSAVRRGGTFGPVGDIVIDAEASTKLYLRALGQCLLSSYEDFILVKRAIGVRVGKQDPTEVPIGCAGAVSAGVALTQGHGVATFDGFAARQAEIGHQRVDLRCHPCTVQDRRKAHRADGNNADNTERDQNLVQSEA